MYKGLNQTLARGDSNDSPRWLKRQSEVTQTTVRGLFVGWIRLMYKGVNQTLDRGDSNDSPRWLKRQSEVTQTTVWGDSNDSPRFVCRLWLDLCTRVWIKR